MRLKQLRYFKLFNGDDIIGLLSCEDDITVTVVDPVQITTFRIDGSGEMIFDLNPWTFCANTDTITLRREHFFGPYETKPYLQEQYAGFIKLEKDKNGFLEQPKETRRAAFEAFTYQHQTNTKYN